MVRIVAIVAALAALAAVSAPAAAAVKIETSVELALPEFMPDLRPGSIVILDGGADWSAAPAAG